MKKNIILIGGAVALLGVGAYLFIKNKKKTNLGTGVSFGEKPLSSSTLNKPTEIANSEQLVEEVKIKEDIKNLATSIKAKREAISVLQNQLKSIGKLGMRVIISRKISDIQNPLNSDLAKLKELGYTELNGSAVKIG